MDTPTAEGRTPDGLRRVVIDPVTRIEGHAKITLHLDADGNLAEARFHVTEFRGFERFCEGRTFWEMPGISARICGICPVSHLMASAKAGDRILGVAPPPAAVKLRCLMNLAQIVQSHALSFFHLSSPDLLLGFDAPPEQRSIFGLARAQPEAALAGIRVRQWGQQIIAALGGKRIHPAWAVPGGVRGPLAPEERDRIRSGIDEQIGLIQRALALYKESVGRHAEEASAFGAFPTMFLALVQPDGTWDHHGDHLRLVDARGVVVADGIDPARYGDHFAEAAEPWSYLKFPYYAPAGYPEGSYRVGPLARLNVCRRMGTPLADRELAEFRALGDGAVLGSFHFHQARLIEMLGCVERIAELIDDPDLLSRRCRATADVNNLEGVGVSEAPRGTLFHHYRVDENGRVVWVNMLIATGQNNLAMNRSVRDAAAHYVRPGAELTDGVLNRIEAAVRAYDPCLSCSTHAVGKMPLRVQMLDCHGALLAERTR
jgi:NAD-reducing hydrogenase large subunit